MPGTTEQAIALGRDALDRHAWDEAYAALSEADRSGGLPGEGLEALAWAAYWTARPDETVEILERAYAAYLDEGDRGGAAMMAFRLAEQNGMRGSIPQAQGWGARAQRLAEGDPDLPVHGWLTWMRGLMAWLQGDYEGAIAVYDQALAFAERHDDADLHGMSLHDKGHALCLLGKTREGMALLDEGMAAVVGGEMGPAAAGYVYCGMIAVCSRLGDYRRASEWTDATLRWCERQSIPAFQGVCRVHKAELMRVQGSYAQAEAEALLACEELPRFNFASGLGPAYHEIAEVRRRLGDLAGAEEAFARTHELGHSPEPGLALVRLAQGKLDAAAAGLRQAIEAATDNRCERMRLLAAQAEIAVAAGDLDTARAAADEMRSLVEHFEAPFIHAMEAQVSGAVALAEGDHATALPELRRAHRAWQEVEAPYEAAEARMALARAHAAAGDVEAALMEARAARAAFERLGARPAAERAGQLIGDLGTGAGAATERVTRAFMFTDIAGSTDLIGVIGDEAWEDLLGWHDQTLRSLFASHGGDVAHHTGDGFFVAFEDTPSALRCAVAIQRALAEHRRAHGFALQVRIGVHPGEATRRGQDYAGAEVHTAARIAALANGGEILASESAAEDRSFDLADVREVTLKGVSHPVRVGRLDWR